MSAAPDFRELAADHGIELDKDTIDAAHRRRGQRSTLPPPRAMRSGAYWMLQARPRRGDVQLLGRQEKLVLDFVRGKVPVVLPDWQVHTDKLIAYRVLPGMPAAEIDPLMGELIWRLPQKSVPATFAQSLATALVALHALDTGAAIEAGLPAVDGGASCASG